MDLSEYTSDAIKADRAQNLLSLRRADLLHRVIGSEMRTEPMIATTFWQIFCLSPAYPRTLAKLDVKLPRVKPIIVEHNLRRDLVILDRSPFSSEPANIRVEVSQMELRQGFNRWRQRQQARQDQWLTLLPTRDVLKDLEILNVITEFGGELAGEASEVGDFYMVVAPAPRLEQSAVPIPAWGVSDGGAPHSTVGVVAQNSLGTVGVTAAWHAITATSGPIQPGVTSAVVDGHAGTVISADPVTDSCFVELPSGTMSPSSRGSAGPLTGVSPRAHEQADFEGVTSGSASTQLIAWDLDVPNGLPGSQQKVYTRPDTARGDSGAALVDDEDHVIGFAFARTALGEPVEYSAWIWADSVYEAHDLEVV